MRLSKAIEYETLYHLYVEKMWTQQAVADHLGSTIHIVRKHLAQYRIPTSWLPRKLRMTEADLQHYLYHLYVEQNQTVVEVARQLQVASSTLGRYLKSSGIKKPHPLVCPQKLRKLYLEQFLPLSQIAERLHCTIRQIYSLIDQYEIPRREPAMGLRKKMGMNDEQLFKYFYHLYWDQQETMQQIADRVGVTHLAIYRHFQRLGIPTRGRRRKKAGEEEGR